MSTFRMIKRSVRKKIEKDHKHTPQVILVVYYAKPCHPTSTKR
ncbi:hypothetical protein [Neobacillus paridis]|nr:hypothetical protein [Neobacillus paridis]